MMGTEEKSSQASLPIVGLIPAGGQGSRLAPLPCSKEILPLGFYDSPEKGEQRPKVACHYLLDSMRQAGVQKAFIILRPGKWDIPAYFGNGQAVGIHLAYLVREYPFGVPFTLDSAFPFLQGCKVACGLPDILIQPEGAFRQLAQKQEDTGADLVLGVFPTDQVCKWDLVELSGTGMVKRITQRPHQGKKGYTWCISIWSPRFSRFLHRYVEKALESIRDAETFQLDDEIHLGTVFQAAIDDGLLVEHVLFDEGSCLDIGTPEDLKKALIMHLGSSEG